MDHALATLGLQLSYLRGRRVIGAAARKRLFDDLLEGTPPSEALVWAARPVLSDYDHVVLASDMQSGNTLGLVGAHDHCARTGPFVWLEAGFVAERARGQNLLRRMIALLLLRIAGFGSVPAAIATLTYNPVAVHVLRQMSGELDQARFAPASDGPVVDLASVMLTRDIAAALGQRFAYARSIRSNTDGIAAMQGGAEGRAATIAAPMLAMLDLRQASEGRLIADLRALSMAGTARPAKARPSARPCTQDRASQPSLEVVAAS